MTAPKEIWIDDEYAKWVKNCGVVVGSASNKKQGPYTNHYILASHILEHLKTLSDSELSKAGFVKKKKADYQLKALLLDVFKNCFTGLTMTDSDYVSSYLDGLSKEFYEIADKEGIEIPCWKCEEGWIMEDGGKKYSSCPRCNPKGLNK